MASRIEHLATSGRNPYPDTPEELNPWSYEDRFVVDEKNPTGAGPSTIPGVTDPYVQTFTAPATQVNGNTGWLNKGDLTGILDQMSSVMPPPPGSGAGGGREGETLKDRMEQETAAAHRQAGVPNITRSVSGGGSSSPLVPTGSTSTQTTTSTWKPTMARPELGEAPEYAAPEYDEDKVRSIAQRIAAPAIMRQRRDMLAAVAQSGRYFGNPIARAEATRRALRAYGLGAASTLAQSESAARSQYQQEYSTQVNEALTNFQTLLQDRMTRYNSALEEYLRTGEQVSTTTGSTTQSYKTRAGALAAGGGGAEGEGDTGIWKTGVGGERTRIVGVDPKSGKNVIEYGSRDPGLTPGGGRRAW